MRTLFVSASVLCAVILAGTNSKGQGMYQVTFRGTSAQTNSAGGFLTRSITDKTWVKDIAQSAGVTDLSTLMVVYHIQGSSFGDTIDVINPKTGAVDDTLFGFYFGEAFGRLAMTNAAGNSVKRLDYIYTKQNNHSFGDALVTKTTVTNKTGTVRTTIGGTMNYIITPDGNGGLRICNGTFTTGKELFFTNAP
jgi:hypothetical protein